MRFDEIKTFDDCDAYLAQMYALYSMPKNTAVFEEWWVYVTAEVAIRRSQIMAENMKKVQMAPPTPDEPAWAEEPWDGGHVMDTASKYRR